MKNLFIILGIITFIVACEVEEPATPKDLAKESLIPKPVSLAATGSSFKIKPETDIFIKGDNDLLVGIGSYLANLLKPSTGYDISVSASGENNTTGHFLLELVEDESLGKEGYELLITKDQVNLKASQPAGLFYGIQTIRQLLPANVERNNQQNEAWEIATGTIRDYPEYEYRGAMLDVARHFFSVADVKRYIDFLASYKMNVLHLHLSDDQGWRIEIETWPELTLIGGSTQVGGGKGGFYTKQQYAEIVQYAQDNFITIVPEIDMPGHTNAALASYPELNCNGKAPELYTGIEVGFSTLCTDKEVTYEFVNDVIRELAVMTPGPYIHVGGDESHATPLEDYIPFINRVQEIVESHDKIMIGWDEVANAKLNPGSIAQFWKFTENAKMAIDQGAKLIMSPASKTYMDMKYDSTTELGLAWAGLIEVNTGYDWDPTTLTDTISRANILGVEAPLWSETVTNMNEIEYMVFPRLLGYAEIGWTPVDQRSWEDYKVRLSQFEPRFKALNIDFYESPVVPWSDLKN